MQNKGHLFAVSANHTQVPVPPPPSTYPPVSVLSTAVTQGVPGPARKGNLSLAVQHQTLISISVMTLQRGCWDCWIPASGFSAFDTCQLLYPVFLNASLVAGAFHSSVLQSCCTKFCSPPFSCICCSCTDGGITTLLQVVGSSDHFYL